MSLAGQITDTINAIAAGREARAHSLGAIRQETTRFLKDARASQHRTAAAQKKALAESVRTTKLAAAITLGAAAQQIDGYRKARQQRAEQIVADLAAGAEALRANTADWLGGTFATRRQKALGDQRDRGQAVATLRKDVGALRASHAAFLDALSEDRVAASVLWFERNAKPAAAKSAGKTKSDATAKPAPKAAVEKVEAAPIVQDAQPVDVVKPEPVKETKASKSAKTDEPKVEDVKPQTDFIPSSF
ncbi:hypothetical protein [Segnochrobactrum spirostomi]|uniref:Uncharacterized protein n=1 Tax=Segnochrobactrum spirostomi TaxID=2608987 RepID=A0A6A7Y6A8_9HYPH|nr:hypothetical protein [Segnochrobactrum spirostomi]MQT14774.1 hypothetical protein [Segnochrobactrum spirostomi]